MLARAAAVLTAAVLGGCCPAPAAPDAAAGDGGLAMRPALSAIQERLFDRHCVSSCHEPSAPAAGLVLARGRSYGELVHRPSQQLAGQVRVVPGDPERSYLLKKLEGASGIVGERMPRLAPPRPQGELRAVRVWIQRGAADD